MNLHLRTVIAGGMAAGAAVGPAPAQSATYRLTVDNTWSEATHPDGVPANAHFSWLGGVTHDDTVSFWSVGELASPGMVQMAETGVTTMLLAEGQSAIDAGSAAGLLDWPWWFCPAVTTHSSCGALVVEFEIDAVHAHVTLATMLGPSPDWFVGVSGLPLRADGAWLDDVVVDLHPYDGGTRAGNVYALFGPLTVPPEPITLITEASGQIITPASLGTFTFTRIDACPIDLDGDGAVSFGDVLLVLSNWGPCALDCPSDLDGDDVVGFGDLLVVLSGWGPC